MNFIHSKGTCCLCFRQKTCDIIRIEEGVASTTASSSKCANVSVIPSEEGVACSSKARVACVTVTYKEKNVGPIFLSFSLKE